MIHYEYLKVSSGLKLMIEEDMNSFGVLGWELVTVIYYNDFEYFYLFKRPQK